MKLSTTITGNCISTNAKLNYVCGNYVCEKHIDKSIQELFIESIDRAGLITETQLGAVASWVKSLISQMKAASAPEQAKDLNILLKFVAPKGGGIKNVDNLVRSARQLSGNILNNKQWWNDIFNSFGIENESIKGNVLKKFGALQNPQISPPTQPTDDTTSTNIAQPNQQNIPNTQQNIPNQQPNTQPSSFNQLRDIIAKRVEFSDKIADLNTKLKADIQARQAELLKRIKELQAQQAATQPAKPTKPRIRRAAVAEPSTESTLTTYAQLLLEFPQVRANLPAITRTIALSNGGQQIVIQENGIMERTRRAVGGGGLLNKLGQVGNTIGQIATRPRQATTKFQAETTANDNERIAKEVIKTLTEIQRQRFTTHLKSKKIEPK
jgi:hypothetical protein